MMRTDGTADYVVVGGGLAGCVVAARLSQRPDVRVVLLEAGDENQFEASYYVTGAHAVWETKANWAFETTPQLALNGRRIDQPRGKVIGGSAALNVGSWSRGVSEDYDAWEAAGATGWNWADALMTFQSVEASRRPPDPSRGRGGPLLLEDTPLVSEMTELLRRACLEAGYGATSDHNGSQLAGFDLWETIFPQGRRMNTAAAYLDPARPRDNLKILTGASVHRIVFEGRRAVGVAFELGGIPRVVQAEREIILCAGVFGTPQLLMLSGIGSAESLRANSIDVLVDSAGVGSNLIDHLATRLGWAAGGPSEVSPVHADPSDLTQIEEWRRTGYGPLSWNPSTSIAFVRSSERVSVPDVELLFAVNPPEDLQSDPQAGGFTVLAANVQPTSRGEIRLAGPDPHDAPLIDPRYLSHPADMPVMVGAVRRAMALAETSALRPYTARHHLAVGAPDAEVEDWIRDHSVSLYHPVSTVRMGREADGAPLDDRARVRGVDGLRVLDSSSLPGTIRGHTMAPTIYLAERGCKLIDADGRAASRGPLI